MTYGLPKTLEICGESYDIRTDFRETLELLSILNDPDLNEQERGFLSLLFFYNDFDKMPPEAYKEAIEKCMWFVNGGEYPAEDGPKEKLMDWEKDYTYIVPAVNKIVGKEVREVEYMHWWTFLGAFMEIGDCTFAQIVHIRSQLKKGKKLDKSDAEWYRKNHDIVDMKEKFSAEENELLKMWGGG